MTDSTEPMEGPEVLPPDDSETEDGGTTSVRQDQMIIALLDNLTQEKAAAALGISPVTLWRQMQNPKFAAAFREARRQAVSLAVARLQNAAGAAVTTQLRIMTDREAPYSTRLRAADMILQGALRGMEIEDIDARVAELERSMATSKQGGYR